MSAVRGSPHETAPLPEATGLTVRFGKVTALDGLELTAPAGQVLAALAFPCVISAQNNRRTPNAGENPCLQP